MKFAILVLFFVAAALAAPLRPVVSETFEAKINLEFTNNTHHLFGEGEQAQNWSSNAAVIRVEFGTRPPTVIYELARYDLGHSYEIDNVNLTTCHVGDVSGHLPASWDWLKTANYTGQSIFRGERFDWWNTSFVVQGIQIKLAGAFRDAGSNAPTIPAFFESEYTLRNNFERRTIGIEDWANTTHSVFFDVPKSCNQTLY